MAFPSESGNIANWPWLSFLVTINMASETTITSRGRQKNAPTPQILCPNPQNLWVYSVTWQKAIKVQMELRFLISQPKNKELILDRLGRPSVIIKVLKDRRERQECQCQWSWSDMRKTWPVTHCWLWRKGTQAKECGQALEAGKGKKMILPRVSGKDWAQLTPWV